MLILKQTPMELKSIIGKRTTEHGQLVRMNRIALEQIKDILKDKELSTEAKKNRIDYLFGETYTNESLMAYALHMGCIHSENGNVNLSGIGYRFHLDGYRTDELKGICEDGDVNCVRLVKDDGKVIKKKVGKVIAQFLDQETFMFCPQAKTYICEKIAEQWKAYASEHSTEANKLDLVVDDDFEAIYNKDLQEGEFNSCMNGRDCVSFYNAIGASAASLRNRNGKIVARCVVFNEVYDMDGNRYRYAERQYSTNQDLSLQQQLVNRLYAGDFIDLHKRVGASCWDHDSVVNKDNERFGKVLYLEHHFDYDDPVPFMDGFAYYDTESERIYNRSGCNDGTEVKLDNTNGYFSRRGEDESRTCENCGREIDEDDEHWSEYHNTVVCDECGVWSDILDDWLVADDCVEVKDSHGYSHWMPDDWNSNARHDFYCEVNGNCYFDDCCCYDELNEEDILYDESVEYNYHTKWGWDTARTHKNEIDNHIVEFDGEYWNVADCVEVEGCWYPFDQVPEVEEEEEEEFYCLGAA